MTFSLVIETLNLAAERASLESALHSLDQGEITPADALEILVIDPSAAAPDRLSSLQQRYPRLRVVPVPGDANYVQTKIAGAETARGDIVVFTDSDCLYSDGWLDEVLGSFSGPGVHIVAGETFIEVHDARTLALALMWAMEPFSGRAAPYPADVYNANGVAMRRTLLEAIPIEDLPGTTRSGTSQHAARLVRAGHTIWRNPRARSWHAPPVLWLKMLWQGHDSVALQRLNDDPKGETRRWWKRLAQPWRRFRAIAAEERRAWRWLPGALPRVLFGGVCYLLGRATGHLLPGRLQRVVTRP